MQGRYKTDDYSVRKKIGEVVEMLQTFMRINGDARVSEMDMLASESAQQFLSSSSGMVCRLRTLRRVVGSLQSLQCSVSHQGPGEGGGEREKVLF